MDPFVPTLSRKRSRSEDDEDEEMSYSFGSFMDDSRKRRRNDTLTDDLLGFPSIASNLHEVSMPTIVAEETPAIQPITLARPPLFRARTLPFRLPSFPTLHSLQSPEYASCSSEQSSPESSSPSSLISLHPFAELPGASTDLDSQMDSNMDTDMDVEAEQPVQIRGSVSPVSPFRVPQRPKQRPDIGIKVHPIERNQMTNGHVLTPFSAPHSGSPRGSFSSQRIPTPMYTSFPGPASSLQVPGSGATSAAPTQVPSLFNTSPNRKLSHLSPIRAIPSPIREDTMDDMVTDYAGSQLSRLSVSERMEMDTSAVMEQQRVEASSAIDITETLIEMPRKGRTRSGAMLSPTQRIFTGYMADCEKCRLNFPGHSMHILPA